jgi:hypothetical protein
MTLIATMAPRHCVTVDSMSPSRAPEVQSSLRFSASEVMYYMPSSGINARCQRV